MVTRTWSRNTQPARWIIATLSFNCCSPMGAVEEVGCTCPWRDRAWPRHTHPVPIFSADSVYIITLDQYYRPLVDILIFWFLSGMATRTWSRNTRPAHWIIVIFVVQLWLPSGEVEIVPCMDPWWDSAWPRHTHPVPVPMFLSFKQLNLLPDLVLVLFFSFVLFVLLLNTATCHLPRAGGPSSWTVKPTWNDAQRPKFVQIQ